MAEQITRKNHYVPEWYQRGFLQAGQSELYYLDMMPPFIGLLDGRIVPKKEALRKQGPNGCFFECDLYTTHFGTVVNDEIEKFLFGRIDDIGSRAVRAFANGDLHSIHYSFQDFFEYLDAQKLRTPKGLDWIKSRYSSLDQLQLMQEMQGLRRIHCTMWAEGVREIVSAEDSDIKFIVSDHPVTVYNPSTSPKSVECTYPEDPPIEWIGTITIFALDANTCIILTHLEYEKDSKTDTLTLPRTNARYYGQSLVRTDAFIRTRKLSRIEVNAINYLLKSRAGRYVAASNTEWLYPEKSFTGTWKDLAQVLLPKDNLWQFGGEIFVGYANGSTHYQDAFGQTSGSHEYLRRKEISESIGPNDACGCGSGRIFKDCCMDVPLTERPTWDVYGIRERNLIFCHAVKDILGLMSGKTWDDVRRELSNEQVKRIHDIFTSLWPEDTDLTKLLPRPKKGSFRSVYLGPSDPRTVVATILGWLPYFDEVILAHPFPNPLRIRPEFSPTNSPGQHKASTLKNSLLLLMIEPYIQAGLVHLIPDPGDFNPQFGMSALHMAEQRMTGWEMDRTTSGSLHLLAEDDFKRFIGQLPESSLRGVIRNNMPEASGIQIDQIIDQIKIEALADPYALLQPVGPGDGGQLLGFKGYSLEAAMYLASLTGSSIYTDIEAHWQQLHLCALQTDREPNPKWAPLVDTIRGLSFPISINPDILQKDLKSGHFESIRAVLRHLSDLLRDSSASSSCVDQTSQQLIKTFQSVNHKRLDDENKSRLVGHVELSVPITGFERNEIRRLLLTFGRVNSARPVPFAILIKLNKFEVTGG